MHSSIVAAAMCKECHVVKKHAYMLKCSREYGDLTGVDRTGTRPTLFTGPERLKRLEAPA